MEDATGTEISTLHYTMGRDCCCQVVKMLYVLSHLKTKNGNQACEIWYQHPMLSRRTCGEVGRETASTAMEETAGR